jgi:hypothetical protein
VRDADSETFGVFDRLERAARISDALAAPERYHAKSKIGVGNSGKAQAGEPLEPPTD